MEFHYYGMRLRGFSLGTQPSGAILITENFMEYYSIIAYERKLTEKEMLDYDLDHINSITLNKNLSNKYITEQARLLFDMIYSEK